MSQNSTYKSSTSKFKSKPLILSGERFFQNLEEPNFWGLSRNLITDITVYCTAVTSTYVVLYTNMYIVFCKNEIC